MVFIPKDFGNVPGNVNFLQASTIGAVTKSQARSGVFKKKSLITLQKPQLLCFDWDYFFLLKEISAI